MLLKLLSVAALSLLVAVKVAAVNPTSDEDDAAKGKHWALLVAGSVDWDNYRHQADVCHAYQILSKHGIPDEQIVVMMFDDIADNVLNPDKGTIVNRVRGPNVYEGVPKDYTGNEVKPEVFLKVLEGDADGVRELLGRDGKVIASGPNDRVFVNFVDHGAAGLLAFPSDVLHAKPLHQVIKRMYNKNLYKQMVFYVEACESGSMFENILEDDINVFVTTAANATESSYACYYDNHLQTYVGDVYSVNWMQDSDQENLKNETLRKQYKVVKHETTQSHVQEYGDLTIGNRMVADFQGTANLNSLHFSQDRQGSHPSDDAVPSEQVPMEILKRKIESSVGEEKEKHASAMAKLIKRKRDTEVFFQRILSQVTHVGWFEYFMSIQPHFSDFTCYEESVNMILRLCPGLNLPQNDYALRKLRMLANLCETDFTSQKIWRAVAKVSTQAEICL